MGSVSDGGSGRGDDVSVHAVLADTRSLIGRLRDRERGSDTLVIHVQTLAEKISSMKEYDGDLREIKETGSHKPGGRSALVHSLQQENRQIRQLQEENRQLKLLLEEHQSVMALVMKRHRDMVRHGAQLSRLESALHAALQYDNGGGASARRGDNGPPAAMADCDEAHKFATVFDRCLRLGEAAAHRDQAELARLRSENVGLRELLRIGGKSEPRLVKLFVNFAREQGRLDPSLKWSPADGDDDDASTPVEERSKENVSLESLIAVAAAVASNSDGSVVEPAAASSSDSHMATVLYNGGGGDDSAGSGSDSSTSPNVSPTAPKAADEIADADAAEQSGTMRRAAGGETAAATATCSPATAAANAENNNAAAPPPPPAAKGAAAASAAGTSSPLVNGSPAAELKHYLKSAGGAIKDKLAGGGGSPTKGTGGGGVAKTGTVKRADKTKAAVATGGAKSTSPAAALRT